MRNPTNHVQFEIKCEETYLDLIFNATRSQTVARIAVRTASQQSIK